MPSGAFDVESFYAALDSHRQAKGLTWREVSEQSGVSQPTLSRLSQGKRPDVDGLGSTLGLVRLGCRFFPARRILARTLGAIHCQPARRPQSHP